VVVTRASNNYGPNQFPEKVIPLFITNAIDHRSLPLYGDGGNVRDWLHVDDHCRGVALSSTRASTARSTTSAAATKSATWISPTGFCS
jgi:dTDP-glucose 4,6-dehydratase